MLDCWFCKNVIRFKGESYRKLAMEAKRMSGGPWGSNKGQRGVEVVVVGANET